MSAPRPLRSPVDPEELATLRSGDSVLVSGRLIAARDAAHVRFAELIARGEPLPVDLTGATIYYVGPTPAPPGRPIGSAGPTTASRMDATTPALIGLGVRAMIGKGRRSRQVREAMREHGSVYLGAVEGTAALLSACITRADVVAYPDLDTEAVRLLDVRDLPAFVVNDVHGGDLYDDGPRRWRRR